MSRFLTGFGAAVLLAGAAWFFAGSAPTDAQDKGKGSARAAWEYKEYWHDPAKNNMQEINNLGANGWELVTSNYAGGGAAVHVFKRQK